MELELTIQVTPELNRAQKAHPPSGPGTPLEVECDLVLLQGRVNLLHLFWVQRYRRRLHLVGKLHWLIFAHLEGIRHQPGYGDSLEAKDKVGVGEAGVGLGVVVFGLYNDGQLCFQETRQVVLNLVKVGRDDADEGHAGVDHQVRHEHHQPCDDHRYRHHRAEYRKAPDQGMGAFLLTMYEFSWHWIWSLLMVIDNIRRQFLC